MIYTSVYQRILMMSSPRMNWIRRTRIIQAANYSYTYEPQLYYQMIMPTLTQILGPTTRKLTLPDQNKLRVRLVLWWHVMRMTHSQQMKHGILLIKISSMEMNLANSAVTWMVVNRPTGLWPLLMMMLSLMMMEWNNNKKLNIPRRFFCHALYWKSHTEYDTMEQAEGSLSPLTIILDRGNNLNIFINVVYLNVSGKYQHLKNASVERWGYFIIKWLGNLQPILVNYHYLILIISTPLCFAVDMWLLFCR